MINDRTARFLAIARERYRQMKEYVDASARRTIPAMPASAPQQPQERVKPSVARMDRAVLHPAFLRGALAVRHAIDQEGHAGTIEEEYTLQRIKRLEFVLGVAP